MVGVGSDTDGNDEHSYEQWRTTPLDVIIARDWVVELEQGPMELMAELGLRSPSYPDLEHHATWISDDDGDVTRTGVPYRGENLFAQWVLETLLGESRMDVELTAEVAAEMGVMAVAGYSAAVWLQGEVIDLRVLRVASTPLAQAYHALVAGKSAVDEKHFMGGSAN
ncbi:20 kDa protein [Penicillium aurantiogriseum bipartite virus 1]|uniref:20 kDa protein n=1 Tax=Penicillium aurantiogriseum bipartite virus 1 TaxID=1755754 RepID=UPI00071AE1F6|nr:20 kDa protein [Penicillium aurantiogriseum bipartite virus 1]ALO50130.1 20 kDa protein [Penicillium aurantiogriseum bipartite virus 1]